MFAGFRHKFVSSRWLSHRILAVGIALFLLSGNLLAGSVNLAWNAVTASNLGGYKLYYGQSSRNYPSSVDVGSQTAYTLSGLQDGATYYFAVTAYDAARTTESGYSNEVSATVAAAGTVTADFTANQTSGGAPLVVNFTPAATGTITSWKWDFGDGTSNSGTTSTVPNAMKSYGSPGAYTVSLTVTGPSGSVTKTKPNLINVVAPPVANFTASATSGTAPVAVNFADASTGSITSWSWNFGDGTTSTAQNPAHTYSVAGTYPVSLTVTGPGGSVTKTNAGYISVSSGGIGGGGTGAGSGSITGLVAAYGFEEASGPTAADASGNGNHGTIKEAVRITGGRFGNALKFDGVNDWVTINDSPSLDLTSGMTLEAWVYPTVWMGGWRSVIIKEQTSSGIQYLYANTDRNQPAAIVETWNSGEQMVSGVTQLPPNQWTHLAATYDGQYERLYINGVEVSIQQQTGAMATSNGNLRIGGNSIWGEYFQGYIDEVRIYNRALTPAELAKDSTTAINSSNPPQFVVGDKAVEPGVDYRPQGTAGAFLTTAQATKVVTRIQVYLDASSTATELVAGIYGNNNNHPGSLIAQGWLTSLKPGAWNWISIPAMPVTAGTSYWIAILGSKGDIRFRDQLGSGTGAMETSASSTLTSLPSTWSAGTVNSNAPISTYGAGY